MPKQHVAVPLLEGVHSSVEALTLRPPYHDRPHRVR